MVTSPAADCVAVLLRRLRLPRPAAACSAMQPTRALPGFTLGMPPVRPFAGHARVGLINRWIDWPVQSSDRGREVAQRCRGFAFMARDDGPDVLVHSLRDHPRRLRQPAARSAGLFPVGARPAGSAGQRGDPCLSGADRDAGSRAAMPGFFRDARLRQKTLDKSLVLQKSAMLESLRLLGNTRVRYGFLSIRIVAPGPGKLSKPSARGAGLFKRLGMDRSELCRIVK